MHDISTRTSTPVERWLANLTAAALLALTLVVFGAAILGGIADFSGTYEPDFTPAVLGALGTSLAVAWRASLIRRG